MITIIIDPTNNGHLLSRHFRFIVDNLHVCVEFFIELAQPCTSDIDDTLTDDHQRSKSQTVIMGREGTSSKSEEAFPCNI